MPPNTQEQLDRLERRVRELEVELHYFKRPDRFYFKGNIELPTDIGLRLGTATNQKLGFFGRVPAIQHSTAGETVGHNGGGGATLTHTDTFYGGLTFSTGNRYTINDIVKALKTYGLMAP